MPGKSVCVVGAGLSGLISVKECRSQGLIPTCYEINSDCGGMWKARDEKFAKNCISLWPNFITNSSKWANCFSDFPPDPKDPPLMTQQDMYQYFQRFAKNFNLFQDIHFNTEVVWIRKTPDHETSGQWEVFTRPTTDSKESGQSSNRPYKKLDDEEKKEVMSICKKETFDFVIIASGYFQYPRYPTVPGSSDFKGDLHHSFDYNDPKIYEDKNVLIVGNKFSALDIADDIGHVAKQTYLAVGDGTWIVPRVYPGGSTKDQLITRDLIYDKNYRKRWNKFTVSVAQSRLDHEALRIVPPGEPYLAPFGYGDALVVKIMSGRVKLFGRLTRFTSREAHFKDGNVIPDLDAVVFCTGYGSDLPFLDVEIIQSNGKMELYKMVFPVHEERHSLAFVGILGCDSPMSMISELQARLATRVMVGTLPMPSKEEMIRDSNFWNEINWKVKKSYNYFLPGLELMDSIADVMGVYPSFWKLVLRDPSLAHRVWYGSVTGAHYRLVGPDNQWEQARQYCHQNYVERAQCLCNIDINLRQTQPSAYAVEKPSIPWLTIVFLSAAGCVAAILIGHRRIP